MNHDPNKYNIKQLSTWPDAIATAKKLNGVKGGISPDHGVFIPSWETPLPGFEQPNFYDEKTGKAYFSIHYKFNKTPKEANAGLVQDLFSKYPESYVIDELNRELNG